MQQESERKGRKMQFYQVYLARTESFYVLLFTCNNPYFYNFTVLVHVPVV